MLVSDGDSKAPSDKLRSSLRSRESSDSGFRMSALLIVRKAGNKKMMRKTPKQQIEERINRDSLRHCLNTTGSVIKFMYGRYTPKTIDRISGERTISYKAMLELLYKVHEERPELDIPGLVEKAILEATVETRSYDHPWRAHREFILNLKATIDIFVTHLMNQVKGEVSFDISDEILHIAGSRVRENKYELNKSRAWRMIEAQMAMLKKAGVTREIFAMTEEENEEAIKELERRAPKPIPRFHDDDEEPAVEEPAVEEPAVEEPAVEEPVVEEPVVEEPVVEEPVVEEPVAEAPSVTDSLKQMQANLEKLLNANNNLVVEPVATEEPVAEKATEEEIEVTWEEPAAEVVEEEKPKRKSRKKAAETEEAANGKTKDEAAAEEAVEKPKRRTRKKAETAEEATAEPAVEATEEEKPKRRSRKKVAETEEDAESVKTEETDEEKAKKAAKKKVKKEDNKEAADKTKKKSKKDKDEKKKEKTKAEE